MGSGSVSLVKHLAGSDQVQLAIGTWQQPLAVSELRGELELWAAMSIIHHPELENKISFKNNHDGRLVHSPSDMVVIPLVNEATRVDLRPRLLLVGSPLLWQSSIVYPGWWKIASLARFQTGWPMRKQTTF